MYFSRPLRERPPRERTTTLIGRRATHFLYDRRTRDLQGRTPAYPFPGLQETLAIHLAELLPARIVARLGPEGVTRLAARLTRVLAAAAHVGYRGGSLARRSAIRVRAALAGRASEAGTGSGRPASRTP